MDFRGKLRKLKGILVNCPKGNKTKKIKNKLLIIFSIVGKA